MRRFSSLLSIGLLACVVMTGCSSSTKELTLDAKHAPLPDYVMNSTEKIQETYVMAAQYPEVVASVPCYCGCFAEDGHESNLDCYIDKMGQDNAVVEWDPMSIS